MAQPTTGNGKPFHINNVPYGIKILEKWKDRNIITSDDESIIKDYVKERTAQASLSTGRQNKLYIILSSWRRFLPEYQTMTMSDLYSGLSRLSNGEANDGNLTLSKNYVYDHVTIGKAFWFWLIDEGHNKNLIEKKIRAIKRPSKLIMTKKAGDLLTEQEVRQMLVACKTSRDKALIGLLYEAGMRIGEIGSLRWNQVKFDEYGLSVNVDFKTGKPRFIRCVFCEPYLKVWKHDATRKADDDFVFTTMQKTAPTYQMLYRQIKRIADRAGIKKEVHPHIFRHSRITHLLQQGLSESVVKMMMWGSLNTDMFQSYAHLTGADVDNAVLQLHGIKPKTPEERAQILAARECPQCHAIVSPTDKFCNNCAYPLSEEFKQSIEAKTKAIENSPRHVSDIDQIMARMRELEEQIKKIQGPQT